MFPHRLILTVTARPILRSSVQVRAYGGSSKVPPVFSGLSSVQAAIKRFRAIIRVMAKRILLFGGRLPVFGMSSEAKITHTLPSPLERRAIGRRLVIMTATGDLIPRCSVRLIRRGLFKGQQPER